MRRRQIYVPLYPRPSPDYRYSISYLGIILQDLWYTEDFMYVRTIKEIVYAQWSWTPMNMHKSKKELLSKIFDDHQNENIGVW